MLNAIALATTISAVYLACNVTISWGPAAIKAANNKKKTPSDWLTIGVFIGFIAFIFNTAFWAVDNAATLFEKIHMHDTLYSYSTAANLFTKDIPYLVAACCHLLAYAQMTNKVNNYKNKLYVTGIMFVAVLMLALVLS